MINNAHDNNMLMINNYINIYKSTCKVGTANSPQYTNQKTKTFKLIHNVFITNICVKQYKI